MTSNLPPERIADNLPPVLVAVPCLDWTWTEAMLAQMRLQVPAGSAFSHALHGTTIAAKRTRLAEQFLENPAFEALLFLDADMAPPPDALLRLLAHDRPIVGALCFARRAPFVAAAGHYLPDGGYTTLADFGGPDPLRRVNLIGTGFLLIRRAALEAIPQPWFRHPEDAPPGEGEDNHFCRQAARAGLPLYCDTGLCVGHLGVTSVDLEYVRGWACTTEAAELLPETTGAGALPHRRRGPALPQGLSHQLEGMLRQAVAKGGHS